MQKTYRINQFLATNTGRYANTDADPSTTRKRKCDQMT